MRMGRSHCIIRMGRGSVSLFAHASHHISQSSCLLISLPICLSFCLSVCLFFYLSVRPSLSHCLFLEERRTSKFSIHNNFNYFGVFSQFGYLCIWCFEIPRGSPVIPTGSTIIPTTFDTCSAIDQYFSNKSDKKYKNSDFSQFWIILASFGAP